MIKRKQLLFLLVIILLSVGLKIFLLSDFNSPNYESFLGVRQVASIQETGKPLLFDELSYQGRTHATGFLFYYILYFFSLFIPLFSLFMYSSIFLGALSLVLIFLIVKKLFPAKGVAGLVTLLAALTPSLFTAYLNTLTTSSVFMVLFLALVYAFIHIEKQKGIWWFIGLFLLSSFITPLALVVVLAFFIYFLLLKTEQLSFKKKESELFFFSSTFVVWFYLLFHKKLLVAHGFDVIWQNIPSELVGLYFQGLTVPLALSLVGLVPLVLGCYALYYSLFKDRNRKLIFLTSLTLSFGLLSWLGFLPIREGLIFTTFLLVILSGYSLSRINTYLKKTKITILKPLLVLSFIALIVLSFIPVLFYKPVIDSRVPSSEELEAFSSLQDTLPADATVISHPLEGNMIAYTTQRKTFMDTAFLLAPDVSKRYTATKQTYLAITSLGATKPMNEYHITHLAVTNITQQYFGDQNFISKENCFIPILQTNSTKVYELQCEENQ